MSSMSFKSFAFAGALMLTLPTAVTAAIECSQIQTKFARGVVNEGVKRMMAVIAEAEALPSIGGRQHELAADRKICEAANEVVGLYKFLRAIAVECSKSGEQTGERSLQDIERSLTEVQDERKEWCGR